MRTRGNSMPESEFREDTRSRVVAHGLSWAVTLIGVLVLIGWVSLADVRKLTGDNPNQQRVLDQIEPLIAQRVESADQLITARNQQDFAAAQQLVANGTGAALTDNIYLPLQRVQDEELSLLEKRKNQSEAVSVNTFLLLPIGLFLVLASLSLGVFLLNAGVGERIRAEQAASDSEARLAGIVNSAMDAIISIDADQRIVLFNAAAEKIFRCAAKTVMGQPIDIFIPKQFREEHRLQVEGFGRTGSHVALHAFSGHSKRGARGWRGVSNRSVHFANRSSGRKVLYGHPARHHRA